MNALPIVTEYDNALFINDYRVPFVIDNSVVVNHNDKIITLSIAVSEYERIREKKEPVKTYEFKDNLQSQSCYCFNY